MKRILFRGSGEVGGAVDRELIKSDACSQLTTLGPTDLNTMSGIDALPLILLFLL